MATREETTWAYRLLLDREPESEEALRGWDEIPLPLVTSSILLSEEFLQNNSWLILETLKLSESPASSEPSHG
jgi:hypothetical protein